jgi:hypothetical protein
MKLAPYLFGVISAQGSGDYDYGAVVDEGDRGSYGGSYSGGYSSGYDAPSYSFNYGGRAGTPLTVTAVTCWESNNMGTHGAAKGNSGDEHTNHFFDSRDGFGWDHTHHGHQTSVGTVHRHLPDDSTAKDAPDDVDDTPNSGVSPHDYHSELAFDHRLSGCIYEASGWTYNALTYNRYHEMSYGAGSNGSNGYDSNNGELFPVWWHYFNSHVLPGGSTINHKLVMANPTYEGLGYLNFIVTFLKSNSNTNAVGGGSSDREMNGNDHSNSDPNHTDLYSNGSAFSLLLNADSTNPCADYASATNSNKCWYSLYDTTSNTSNNWSSTNIAISSFPHNDLGKDFRFNLRILHHIGEGNAALFYDSYYWYRVNKITITFPYVVSCPWDISGSSSSNGSNGNMVIHKCMDSAGLNGHVFWQDSGDSGATAGDGEGTRQVAYVETITDTDGDVESKYLGICVDAAGSAKRGQHKCGKQYSVQGLMNAYDEYAQQEYGTHQEHWFQFYYKFQNGDDSNGSSNAGDGNDLEDKNLYIYNYPNKLFNAFEVKTIAVACEEGDSNNNWTKNQCLSKDPGTARAHEHWSSPQNGSPTSG